jgi:hypothetical protein
MILAGIAIVLGGIVVAVAQSPSAAPHSIPLHVSNTFEFDVKEPLQQVAPLFGAHRERVWAEGWDPQFVYPQPAADQQGSVFQVSHGAHKSTWITTIFDPEKGHIQYAYFVPEAMAVLIDIHLSVAPGSGTHVQVRYDRTALSSELNEHIRHQGEQDAKSAEEWRSSIEGYFGAKRQRN